PRKETWATDQPAPPRSSRKSPLRVPTKSVLAMIVLSSSRERLHHVDGGAGAYLLAEIVAVADLLSIDEDHHVLPERPLLVEHVAAHRGLFAEVALEHLEHRAPRDVARGAADVSFQ